MLEAAARNLTPTALELGGETGNWSIVRADADLKDAARKIAFFKALNSGQICIDINQVAVAEEVAEDFVRELKAAFERQLGPDPLQNPEYPRLITRAAYEKCAATAERYRSRIIYGGAGDAERLRYAPTILYPIDRDEEIHQRAQCSSCLSRPPTPAQSASGSEPPPPAHGCLSRRVGVPGVHASLRGADRLDTAESPSPGASLRRGGRKSQTLFHRSFRALR